MKKSLSVLSCLIMLSGCATYMEGTTQDVTVTTNPEGATCNLVRDYEIVSVVTTPATIHLDRTQDDIVVTCNKVGYHEVVTVDRSGYNKDNWAYFLIGGPIGWGVDSTTGADNHYASPFNVNLEPW